MRKKWMVYASWAFALVTGLVVGSILSQGSGKEAGTLTQLLSGGKRSMEVAGNSYELVLARSYLCGVRDEERKPVAINHLAVSMVDYKGWEIVTADSNKMILMKREHDISPECKENGHFGLSTDGMLTLFHGVPSDQEVVQTFYRINTVKMEASLPKEEVDSLKRGIRVRDLAEYNSVLSTYGEFQLSEE
ncbi:BofC C-terminal domain-containing protein [Brevibacillus choshinensis]|uniref:BofC C-terminal domain-containing protein n=1 Tax=Brevibacillus choshinensis TaxID=54911 RepID=UPI002E1CBCFA|nr:BofC C-terminal domain-containing protein [Brevibacillus choshinensis]